MSWIWGAVVFLAGYAVRHRDMLRFHEQPTPLQQALKDAEAKQRVAAAEKLSKQLKL